jgi:hypothetical protein
MQILLKHPDELIKKRRSCRSFSAIILKNHIHHELLDFIKLLLPKNLPFLNFTQASFEFKIIDKPSNQRPSDSFRIFKNGRNILFASIPGTKLSFESYGYLLQLIALKIIDLNLSSCWVGYFHKPSFSIYLSANNVIPAILLFGYPQKQTIREKIIRFAIKSNNRKPWQDLFFDQSFKIPLKYNTNHPLFHPLELLRLSPSSGNTQPWRLLCQDQSKIVHFFKNPVNRNYNKRKLHNLDMGIAICHFELGLQVEGLSVNWTFMKTQPEHWPAGLEYIISCEINQSST